MKMFGKKISTLNERTLVIPRYGEGSKNLAFKFRPVKDWAEFDVLCPEPKPPMGRKPGEAAVPMLNNPTYLVHMAEHSAKRMHYMFLTSISATEGLEWDEVDMANSDTWEKFEQELLDAGLSNVESNMLVRETMIINTLNQDAIDKARADFLASEADQEDDQPSPTEEQPATASGEPVSASA